MQGLHVVYTAENAAITSRCPVLHQVLLRFLTFHVLWGLRSIQNFRIWFNLVKIGNKSFHLCPQQMKVGKQDRLYLP